MKCRSKFAVGAGLNSNTVNKPSNTNITVRVSTSCIELLPPLPVIQCLKHSLQEGRKSVFTKVPTSDDDDALYNNHISKL